MAAQHSPFASFVTKTIPFPRQVLHAVTLRKLGWKAKQEARDARQRTRIQAAKNVGEVLELIAKAEEIEEERKRKAALAAAAIDGATPTMPPAIDAAPPATPEQTPEEATALKKLQRRDQYDEHTVLCKGVVSWTFGDVKVTPDSLADLDEQDKTDLVDAILDLGEPETAEAQKND